MYKRKGQQKIQIFSKTSNFTNSPCCIDILRRYLVFISFSLSINALLVPASTLSNTTLANANALHHNTHTAFTSCRQYHTAAKFVALVCHLRYSQHTPPPRSSTAFLAYLERRLARCFTSHFAIRIATVIRPHTHLPRHATMSLHQTIHHQYV
jgi:hypothetical protein